MIYTSIIGDYDEERDDVFVFDEYDRFKQDVLNAKIYKALPHLFIEDEWSVWIDGNLHLKVDEQELIEMTKPYDFGAFRHPIRNCVYEEAEACKQQGKGDPDKIDAQMERYRMNGYPENRGLYCGFLLVRRHSPRVEQMNTKWWAEITRGSVRDQLSLPYVFSNIKDLGTVDIRDNKYFKRVGHKK